MEKNKDKNQKEIKQDNDFENINESNDEAINVNDQENKDNNNKALEEEVEELQKEGIDEYETEEDKLKDEIKKLKEEKIRVLAEMENLRKRFEREKIDSIKYGSVNFARDILSPGDNLERALSAINKEEDHPKSIKNLIDGLLMVKKELTTALEKHGIVKIDSLNKKFDPNLHQAMMEIENNELEEGVVVQEIQTGYMMYDRLLRPAMVGVSKKKNKDTQIDPNQDLSSDEASSNKVEKN